VASIEQLGGHRVSWAARTDIGHVRTVNEDDLLVADGLFLVADGMGGHASGDVASRLIVDAFSACVGSELLPMSELSRVIDAANATVFNHASEHRCEGMGSTLVGAALTDAGASVELVVFNVGDSRCYVTDRRLLRQVTRDHSEVQELVDSGLITPEQARTHPNRNVVTRAIGIDRNVSADFVVLGAARRRRLLLCSDGVSGEVPFTELERILTDDQSTPDEAADRLMSMVLAGRAPDNATLIVVDVERPGWIEDDTEVTGPRPKAALDELPPAPSPSADGMITEVLSSWSPVPDDVGSRFEQPAPMIDDVPT
jgi:serine/threonine protein phosphatase PrpC